MCFRIVYCLQVIPQLTQILVLDVLLLLRKSPVHRYHTVDGDESHARAQRQRLQGDELSGYLLVLHDLALLPVVCRRASLLYVVAQGVHILVHADDCLRLIGACDAHVAKAEYVRVRFVNGLFYNRRHGLSSGRLGLHVFVGKLVIQRNGLPVFNGIIGFLLFFQSQQWVLLGHLAVCVHLDLTADWIEAFLEHSCHELFGPAELVTRAVNNVTVVMLLLHLL